MSTEFKTMIVYPGNEIRQEGFTPCNPFGADVESPISAICKELHIHSVGDQTLLTLDNPISGGPVVVCSGEKQEILIPGEQKFFDRKNLTILIKKGGFFQFIFLDSNLFDS